MKCYFCDDEETQRIGGLTPEQHEDNRQWLKSFKVEFNTSHPPHLALPGIPVCQSCLVIYEVMEG